jgi:DASS family divalent anion:Na+ symporter
MQQPPLPDAGARPAPGHEGPAVPAALAWAVVVGAGLGVWLCDVGLGLRPDPVPPWGWRLLAVFVPTVLSLMLRPLPGGACVLLALTACLLFDALPPAPEGLSEGARNAWPYAQALGGYTNDSVWLVLAAYFTSRALIKTGLARRIALTFVRLLGGRPLGLAYALVATDTVLAGLIPSNAARVGGVILPVTRSLAELYQSFPGRSAALLGTFLMVNLYQGDVVNCALFYTGQASNPLAAAAAAQVTQGGVRLHYANWLLYASAPALGSLLVVPWLAHRLTRPTLTHTPEAVGLARAELARMGRPRRDELIMTAVFAGVCLGWVVTGLFFGTRYTTLIALAGGGVLFLSGVLTWDDAVTERGAWDVFIWYGGLVQLGKLLNDTGVVRVFAGWLAGRLDWLPLPLLFGALLLAYFYAHYGFASITAHVLAMFPAFVGVLLALGAPPWLTVVAFATFSNLCAGLTHYGTTPAPIVFQAGYVSQGTWWRVGLILSVVNIGIWLTVGLAWWKLWGLW